MELISLFTRQFFQLKNQSLVYVFRSNTLQSGTDIIGSVGCYVRCDWIIEQFMHCIYMSHQYSKASVARACCLAGLIVVKYCSSLGGRVNFVSRSEVLRS
jgi:hypothetical protein